MPEHHSSLEPRNGDFVAYVEALQAEKLRALHRSGAVEAAGLDGEAPEEGSLRSTFEGWRRRTALKKKRAPRAQARPSRAARSTPPTPVRFAAAAFSLFGVFGILAGTAENNSAAVTFGGLALIIGLAVMASLDRLGRR